MEKEEEQEKEEENLVKKEMAEVKAGLKTD